MPVDRPLRRGRAESSAHLQAFLASAVGGVEVAEGGRRHRLAIEHGVEVSQRPDAPGRVRLIRSRCSSCATSSHVIMHSVTPTRSSDSSTV